MFPSVDDIRHYVDLAYNAPWWAISAGFAFLVCVALRRWPKYPNGLIPVTCLGLAALMTMVTAPKHPVSTTALGWYATNLMIGGILGFLTWGLHNKVLKPLSVKFPWLGSILTGEDGDNQTTPPPKP